MLIYVNKEFYYSDEFSYNKIRKLLSKTFRQQFDSTKVLIVSEQTYFENSQDNFKIAVLYNPFIDNTLTDSSLATIKHFSNISNLVFIIENELFHSWQESHQFKSNVHLIIPGIINPIPLAKNSIVRPHWLQYTTDLYKRLPDKLAELQPCQLKPKMFDALLGYPRDYRTFVYNKIIENNLENQTIISYNPTTKFAEDKFYAHDYFIWEPGTEQLTDHKISYTSNQVSYLGIQCMLSAVIPVQVYNQTAYSIITESYVKSQNSFFTEKIAKPLLARRLFVAFSNYHYLQDLKSLGFKTFSDIIDESYDNVYNSELRWEKAFDQVIWLCQQDQQEILLAIQPIVEYNYQVMMETEWDQQTVDYITKTVQEYYEKNISSVW